MPALSVDRLTKIFRLQHYRPTTLKRALVERFNPSRRSLRRVEDLVALNEISFRVEAGETVGVLGRNGSGKSTLLAVLARVYRPTRGTFCVQGRVTTLLELGGGFHPDLTGEENLQVICALMGLGRRETDAARDSIVAFAELEHFIDSPVRTYSSGMVMRLGFAIAIHGRPDVLLVDEALAVGDESFQQKCYGRIESLQREGKTILFVTHDLNALRRIAPRTLWLDGGKLLKDGPTQDVVSAYLSHERQTEAGGSCSGN